MGEAEQHHETSPSSDRRWVSREVPETGKEHFASQYAFAQKIHERTGMDMDQCIMRFTSLIRGYMYVPVRDIVRGRRRNDIPFERLVDEAYAVYKKGFDASKEKGNTSIQYESTEEAVGWKRFGCFSYEVLFSKPGHVVHLHFNNYEYDATASPLSAAKQAQRIQELTDLFRHLKMHCPQVTHVEGNSWIYNLTGYCSLLPDSYTRSLASIDDTRDLWQTGSIWGQFVRADGSLDTQRMEMLLNAAELIVPCTHELELYKMLNAILPLKPLSARGSVKDFYAHYGIE